MNKDIIKGNWKILKGKVIEQWGKLTDDDIKKLQGSAVELEGVIQEKYGYDRERAQKEINDFINKNNCH